MCCLVVRLDDPVLPPPKAEDVRVGVNSSSFDPHPAVLRPVIAVPERMKQVTKA